MNDLSERDYNEVPTMTEQDKKRLDIVHSIYILADKAECEGIKVLALEFIKNFSRNFGN